MLKIIKYFLLDILKSKVILGLTLFFLIVSFSLMYLDENQNKAVLSLMNIIFIVVPLISMFFSANHYWNSYEFKELLLSLPLKREKIIVSEFIAVGSSIALSIMFGLGVPCLLFGAGFQIIYLILLSALLSVSCVAISMWMVVLTNDKSRGLGYVLLMWFYLTMLYDVLIVSLMLNFSEYPLEKLVVFLAALNPIDLCRISMMLHLDISALMGYTGALYKDFFSGSTGLIFTVLMLVLWIVIPCVLFVRKFRTKDL
ncbi:MAG: ABC transporter permease subunit [Saprospiraceae bacterium]|nr:ABC transporter permease subunit [Saprospiraceae bacterium]